MPSLPSPVRRRRDLSVSTLVSAFESETQAVFVRTAPINEHLILYVLLAMLVIGMVLISVTKLDRVVTGTGKIIPIGGMLFVQPLDKSIIHDIRVKAGDVVKQGQVLATLDPTFTSADLAQLEAKMASTEALVARLEAEHEDQPYRPSGKNQYEVLQGAIWQQRQAEVRSALADFDARIKSLDGTVARFEQDAQTYRERLRVNADLEKMTKKLETEGVGSKMKTLTAVDSRVEISRLLDFSNNQIKENQETIASLKAQRAVYIDQRQSQIGTDLATARDTLNQTREDLKKAQKLNQLVNLVAPADAVVLKIAKASKGSVAGVSDQPVDPLFTLVPLDAPVEAEVEIEARDIGFIRPGDPVQVKLDAYRFLQHGTARGVIKTISEGTFTIGENEEVRPPYFKAIVTFTDIHLRDVPASFRLIPGMTLVGDIMVGKRSIMSYLIEGGMRTSLEAMREP